MIQSTRIPEEHFVFFVTMDIESPYTNVPFDRDLQAAEFLLNQLTNCIPSTHCTSFRLSSHIFFFPFWFWFLPSGVRHKHLGQKWVCLYPRSVASAASAVVIWISMSRLLTSRNTFIKDSIQEWVAQARIRFESMSQAECLNRTKSRASESKITGINSTHLLAEIFNLSFKNTGIHHRKRPSTEKCLPMQPRIVCCDNVFIAFLHYSCFWINTLDMLTYGQWLLTLFQCVWIYDMSWFHVWSDVDTL